MAPDSLYVGDNATNGHSGDNSVQRFDATTAAAPKPAAPAAKPAATKPPGH